MATLYTRPITEPPKKARSRAIEQMNLRRSVFNSLKNDISTWRVRFIVSAVWNCIFIGYLLIKNLF